MPGKVDGGSDVIPPDEGEDGGTEPIPADWDVKYILNQQTIYAKVGAKIPDNWGRYKGIESATYLELSTNVDEIGDYAFYNWEHVTTLKIPSSMMNIGSRAFSSFGSITELELPAKTAFIGESAFNFCNSLTDVTIHAIYPPILSSNSFYNTNQPINIHVPADSLALYKSANRWSEIADQIFPIKGN